MIDGAVIRATHRGVDVVLGRPRRSPHVGGPGLMKAARMLDSLPAPPASRSWLKAAEDQAGVGGLGVMLNDRLGCCTIAAKGHAKQIWTANNGTMVTPPDSAILSDYERVDGYVDGDPSTDNGGVMTDVEVAWQKPGGVAGSQIDAWIPVMLGNLDHYRRSIDRYGIADCGISLPLTAQDQTIWTLDIGGAERALAGSWGGHDAIMVDYDSTSFTFETWGMRQRASNDWVLYYVDEIYTAICKALWCPNGTSPSGYSAADLDADLAAVA